MERECVCARGNVRARITIISTPAGGGNGFANVGFINAAGLDLAGVEIDGDRGRVIAGDILAKTSGLGMLAAQTLGLAGIPTQEPGGDLITEVTGRLGKLKIAIPGYRGASIPSARGTPLISRIASITIAGTDDGTLGGPTAPPSDARLPGGRRGLIG